MSAIQRTSQKSILRVIRVMTLLEPRLLFVLWTALGVWRLHGVEVNLNFRTLGKIVLHTPWFCCLVVDCGQPLLLRHGQVHLTNTTYRSRVNFTCNQGYDLVGISSTVCVANGTWSEEAPLCISKLDYCTLLGITHSVAFMKVLCAINGRVWNFPATSSLIIIYHLI